MESQVDQAISSSNYAQLAHIFTASWHTLGQGEQRTLSAHFIKSSLSHPSFLPAAFSSPSIISAMKLALGHLPPTVENAADNALRHKLFHYFLDEEGDYRAAGCILSGMRMEPLDASSVYYTPDAERTDVYVKIAECFLQQEDYVEAETFVTKAGTSVEGIPREEIEDGRHLSLVLRFKSVYARVLDANRKFLQAAGRYYDLSQVNANMEANRSGAGSTAGAGAGAGAGDTDGNEHENAEMMVDDDDLLEFLGRAATCAILSGSSSSSSSSNINAQRQKHRILGLIHADPRLHQLDSIPHFRTHSSIVTKMYRNEIIAQDNDNDNDNDLSTFIESLSDHQRALMSDGLTLDQRAFMDHTMVAVSRLYTSIYFTDLGKLLGVSPDRAEGMACQMILNGNLVGGTIDEVEGVLNFNAAHSDIDIHNGNEESECSSSAHDGLVSWDNAIASFCTQLNQVTDAVRHHC